MSQDRFYKDNMTIMVAPSNNCVLSELHGSEGIMDGLGDWKCLQEVSPFFHYAILGIE